jgi:hypothetical protein
MLPPDDLIYTIVLSYILIFFVGFSVVKIRKSIINRFGLITFLTTGCILALLRVSCLFYLSYRLKNHTWTYFVSKFKFLLYPESQLLLIYQNQFTPIENPVWLTTIFSLALIIGSFLWALPLLFLKAKKRELLLKDA